MAEVAWFLGLTVDHLYEDCPNRARGRAGLERADWWKQGLGTVDPEGTDICGWCVRVWRARDKAGVL